MSKVYKKQPSKKSVPYLMIGIGLIAIALVGFFALKLTVWKKEPITAAPTTSKQPTAQSGFTSGSGKTVPTTAPDTNVQAADTKGQIATVPSQNQWTTSADKTSIVVYSPANSSLFKSGDALNGTATSKTVYYELEDDVSGVIAQGQANVVNGKYSVNFTFTTTATNGKIRVFNQADDGVESNNVTLQVRFK